MNLKLLNQTTGESDVLILSLPDVEILSVNEERWRTEDICIEVSQKQFSLTHDKTKYTYPISSASHISFLYKLIASKSVLSVRPEKIISHIVDRFAKDHINFGQIVCDVQFRNIVEEIFQNDAPAIKNIQALLQLAYQFISNLITNLYVLVLAHCPIQRSMNFTEILNNESNVECQLRFIKNIKFTDSITPIIIISQSEFEVSLRQPVQQFQSVKLWWQYPQETISSLGAEETMFKIQDFQLKVLNSEDDTQQYINAFQVSPSLQKNALLLKQNLVMKFNNLEYLQPLFLFIDYHYQINNDYSYDPKISYQMTSIFKHLNNDERRRLLKNVESQAFITTPNQYFNSLQTPCYVRLIELSKNISPILEVRPLDQEYEFLKTLQYSNLTDGTIAGSLFTALSFLCNQPFIPTIMKDLLKHANIQFHFNRTEPEPVKGVSNTIGDFTLNIDGSLSQLFALHYLYANPLDEDKDTYFLTENWIRLNFKSLPPVSSLLTQFFAANTQDLLTERKMELPDMLPEFKDNTIIIELFCVPSNEATFLRNSKKEMNTITRKEEILKAIQTQAQQKEEDCEKVKSQKSLEQSYITQQQMYNQDLYNFTVIQITSFIIGLTQVCVVYFEKMFRYRMSIEINKMLLQEETTRKIPNHSSVKFFKLMVEILDMNDNNFTKEQLIEIQSLGYDALKFLTALKKIDLKNYFEKFSIDQLGSGAHKYIHQSMNKINDLIVQLQKVESPAFIKNDNQTYGEDNDNYVQQQRNDFISPEVLLKILFDVELEDNNESNPFQIHYNERPTLPERVFEQRSTRDHFYSEYEIIFKDFKLPFKQYFSFLPEVLEFPLSIFPIVNDDSSSIAQIDLGFVHYRQRLDLYKFFIYEYQEFFKFIHRYCMDIFTMDFQKLQLPNEVLLPKMPKQFTQEAYMRSSYLLAQIIYATLNIRKIILTQYIEGQEVIEIVKQPDSNNVILIMRVINLKLTRVADSNPDFMEKQSTQVKYDSFLQNVLPVTIFREIEYYFDQTADLRQNTFLQFIDPQCVAFKLSEVLKIGQYMNLLNFSRKLQFQVLPLTCTEVRVRMPRHLILKSNNKLAIAESLISQIVNCKFNNFVIGESLQRQLHRIINCGSSLTIGFGDKLDVRFSLNQCRDLVNFFGRFKVIFDNKSINCAQTQSLFDPGNIPASIDKNFLTKKLNYLNPHIEVADPNQQYCLLTFNTTISDKEYTEAYIQQQHGDLLDVIVIPTGLLSSINLIMDNTSYFSVNSTAIIGPFDGTCLSSLVISLPCQSLQQIELEQDLNINRFIPSYAHIQNKNNSETRLLKQYLDLLIESPHLRNIRLPAMRLAMRDISQIFDSKILAFILPETLPLQFCQLVSEIDFAYKLAQTSKLLHFLPIYYTYIHQVFTGSKDYSTDRQVFPLHIMLFSTNYLSDFLLQELSTYIIQTKKEEILQKKERFSTPFEFIHALIPVCIFPSDFFRRINIIENDEEENNTSQEDQQEKLYERNNRFQKQQAVLISMLLGDSGEDFEFSGFRVITDNCYSGFLLMMQIDMKIWVRLIEIIEMIFSIDGIERVFLEVDDFITKVGKLIMFKCQSWIDSIRTSND